MADASLVFLQEVAQALGELRDDVVFIGGAIAPLLQAAPPFDAPRPTGDVDAIAATLSYPEFKRFSEALEQRGFRQPLNAEHADRWITPGPAGIPFDLVPIGQHFGASGNPWDEEAMRTAVRTEIAPGLSIRHASATGFLALKFAAFFDRGIDDPFASADLEDLFALLASRPQVVQEMQDAPEVIKEFVAESASSLLRMDEFEDLIAGHLGNVVRKRAATVIPATTERLRQIAERPEE